MITYNQIRITVIILYEKFVKFRNTIDFKFKNNKYLVIRGVIMFKDII